MCCLCGAKNLKSDLSVIWNISALPVKSQCIRAIKSPRNADTTHINILPYKITPHLQCSKVRQSILPQENSDDAARNKVPNMCQSRPTQGKAVWQPCELLYTCYFDAKQYQYVWLIRRCDKDLHETKYIIADDRKWLGVTLYMTVFGCPEASADILRRSAISFNTGKPQIFYSVLNKIAQSNVGTDRIAGVDFFIWENLWHRSASGSLHRRQKWWSLCCVLCGRSTN